MRVEEKFPSSFTAEPQVLSLQRENEARRLKWDEIEGVGNKVEILTEDLTY